MNGWRERFWRRRSAEERLLLSCCRQQLGPAELAEVRRAAPEVDWRAVLAASVRHQVAPLVFHLLRGAGGLETALPAEVADAFRHATMRNVAAKAAKATALERVLADLEARGVDVMLVKGTALDQRLWEQDWYTTSADVDLLLRARFCDVDDELGARLRAWNSGRPQIDVHAQRHPDLVMNGVLAVDFDAVWAAAEPIEVAGHRAFRMGVEDELLAACINACRKRYFRLKSLCEIGELVRRHPALDWPRFAARARAAGCQRIAFAALLAAHGAGGDVAPPDLRRLLGVARPRAAVLRFLVARMSFGSLLTIHRHRRLLGKYLSRWLVLVYASMSWPQTLRALGVVARQLERAGPRGRE